MHQEHRTVIEQVRTLAAPLSNAERLALIRAIASLETPEREAAPRVTDTQGLDAEQEAWFARPPAERRRYAGEYVAVQDGQVLDHDPDQRALYLRVRAQFGRRPILIIKADWDAPPVFTILCRALPDQSS
jgi:hypothetical protein